MKKFAIVVIGYSRVKCINRLLVSLNEAEYNGENIPIIISIDNSGSDEVLNQVEKFEWKHGEKIIRTFEERQGLRNHVLKCGELTKEYDTIAVFEDDIYVSPMFYNFAIQAAEYYESDDRIAGISLYNFELNPNTNTFFNAEKSEYDTYFINFAQSWGQIWTKNKWSKFISWYSKNCNEFCGDSSIPSNISSWPETSWLKYHIKYCIETNRYFVYPYTALSTNFGDIGQHSEIINPSFQVSLQYGDKKTYKFAPLNSNSIIYDAFFERKNLNIYLNVDEEDVCVDIYGQKGNKDNKRYWITMKKENYKILNSFALSLRPQEMNIIYNIEGMDIYIYDTTEVLKNINKDNSFEKKQIYNFRTLNRKDILKYTIILYKNKLRLLIKKYIK